MITPNNLIYSNHPGEHPLPPKTECVLFDLDGTIINSEHIHAQALAEIISSTLKQTRDLQQLEAKFKGYNDIDVYNSLELKNILPLDQFIESKNKAISQIIETYSLLDIEKIMAPHIRNYLIKLNNEKLKVGLVSASEKDVIINILKKCEIINQFKVIVSRESTALSKPSPSPYFMAMRLFGVTTNKTVIFEDSVAGTTAAVRSGATVFNVKWANR